MKQSYLTEQYYENPEIDIYDINQSLKFYHTRRFKIAYELVRKYHDGGEILDMCCGLAEWNKDKLEVTGIDISKELLHKAMMAGRVLHGIQSNIFSNPFTFESFSLIVCTGTLEHFKYPSLVVAEIRKLLIPRGIAIISVPYEANLGLWKPLFKARCFIEGTIKKREYYLNNMGHINHFTPQTLIPLLKSYNFKILEVINNLTLDFFVVVQK